MRLIPLRLGRSAALAIAASLLSPAARAQTEHPEPPPAESALKLGMMLVEERRWDVACPKFEESYRLDPKPNTLFHLAACWEQIGLLGNARTRFLEVSETATDPGLRASAREHAAALERKLPALVIDVRSADAGLEIAIDGAPLPSGQWGLPLALDAGRHYIDAKALNRKPKRLVFELPRDPQTLSVTVPPLEDEFGRPGKAVAPQETPLPAHNEHARGRVDAALLATGIVLGAVGVGGIVLGTISGLKVGSKNDEADAICPTGVGCTRADLAAYDAAMSDARSARRLAVLGFGIGGTALIGAGILLASSPRGSGPSVGLAPAVGPGLAGATLSGRW